MAQLDQWAEQGRPRKAMDDFGSRYSNMLERTVRTNIKRQAWDWFLLHLEDEILKIKFWVFSYTVKLKELRPLWVMVFGEPV